MRGKFQGGPLPVYKIQVRVNTDGTCYWLTMYRMPRCITLTQHFWQDMWEGLGVGPMPETLQHTHTYCLAASREGLHIARGTEAGEATQGVSAELWTRVLPTTLINIYNKI